MLAFQQTRWIAWLFERFEDMFRQIVWFIGAVMIWSVLWSVLKTIDGVHTQGWMPALAGLGIGLMSLVYNDSNHSKSR